MPPIKMFPGYTKEELKQQGVYGIFCIPVDCVYIGQTYSYFSSRWSVHLSALNRGRHPCKALQEDWEAYGEGGFTFLILDCAPVLRNGDWAFREWRDYLECLRMTEYPLTYNTVKLSTGRPPKGENPYRSMAS